MKEFSGSECFSQPAAANLALRKALEGKDELLASTPSTPAVLQSLLDELNQSADNVNLLRVAEMSVAMNL